MFHHKPSSMYIYIYSWYIRVPSNKPGSWWSLNQNAGSGSFPPPTRVHDGISTCCASVLTNNVTGKSIGFSPLRFHWDAVFIYIHIHTVYIHMNMYVYIHTYTYNLPIYCHWNLPWLLMVHIHIVNGQVRIVSGSKRMMMMMMMMMMMIVAVVVVVVVVVVAVVVVVVVVGWWWWWWWCWLSIVPPYINHASMVINWLPKSFHGFSQSLTIATQLFIIVNHGMSPSILVVESPNHWPLSHLLTIRHC